MSATVSTTPPNRPVIVPSEPLKSASPSGKKVTLIVTAVFSALSLLAASVSAVVSGTDTFSFFCAGVSVAFGITFFLARRIAQNNQEILRSNRLNTILESKITELQAKLSRLELENSRLEQENQKRQTLTQSLVSQAIKDLETNYGDR